MSSDNDINIRLDTAAAAQGQQQWQQQLYGAAEAAITVGQQQQYRHRQGSSYQTAASSTVIWLGPQSTSHLQRLIHVKVYKQTTKTKSQNLCLTAYSCNYST